MNKELSFLEKIGGAIVIHLSPGSLTFESDGLLSKLYVNVTDRLNKWYETNGSYRFKIDQRIRLRNPRILGYDPNEILEVTGYTSEGNYMVKTRTDQETHFKWNIEHHFRRAA